MKVVELMDNSTCRLGMTARVLARVVQEIIICPPRCQIEEELVGWGGMGRVGREIIALVWNMLNSKCLWNTHVSMGTPVSGALDWGITQS